MLAKSARIVGGNTLPPNEDAIPWQVALLNRADGLVICGGALLSNSFILSAAHCRLRLHLNGIGTDKVLIGAKSVTETDKLYILSHIYHIHPEYERYDDPRIRPSIYDLIILIMRTPLLFCNGFVRLPSLKDSLKIEEGDESFYIGKLFKVVGWGSKKPLSYEQVVDINLGKVAFEMDPPDNMHEIDLSYVTKSICQSRYHEFFNHETSRLCQGIRPPNRDTTSIATAGRYRVGNLNFERTSGSAMLCVSTCTAEDVNQCTNIFGHKGTCAADSGCKY